MYCFIVNRWIEATFSFSALWGERERERSAPRTLVGVLVMKSSTAGSLTVHGSAARSSPISVSSELFQVNEIVKSDLWCPWRWSEDLFFSLFASSLLPCSSLSFAHAHAHWLATLTIDFYSHLSLPLSLARTRAHASCSIIHLRHLKGPFCLPPVSSAGDAEPVARGNERVKCKSWLYTTSSLLLV